MNTFKIPIPEGHFITKVDQQSGWVTFKSEDKGLIGRVNTFEKVCKEAGEDPADFMTTSTKPRDIKANAFKRVLLIIEVFQQGRDLDPNTNKDWKYFPRFDLEKDDSNPSGFRFDDSNYSCTYSVSVVGPLLWLPDQKTSDYVGQTFAEEFKNVIQ